MNWECSEELTHAAHLAIKRTMGFGCSLLKNGFSVPTSVCYDRKHPKFS